MDAEDRLMRLVLALGRPRPRTHGGESPPLHSFTCEINAQKFLNRRSSVLIRGFTHGLWNKQHIKPHPSTSGGAIRNPGLNQPVHGV
jgi:hypothetical protein